MKGLALARTAFLQRKMTRYYVVLDVDRDGHIEAEDYEGCAERLAEIRGYSKQSPQYDNLRGLFMKEWNALATYCDDNDDQQVSLDEWFEHREDIRNGLLHGEGDEVLSDEQVKQEVGRVQFALMDNDDDGFVNEQDFVHFYAAYKLPEDLARRMFAKLDTNKTGKLTPSDVIERYYEFTHSTDPNAPGNWFFGPY